VIVDPGHELELGPVLELDATHHVHLPQLHRALALPPAELVAALAAPPQLDQAMTTQAAVDGRTRRQRLDASLGERVADPTRSPAGVLPARLTDQRLDLRGDLMGHALGWCDRSARAARPPCS
jgi:hypothetical protein